MGIFSQAFADAASKPVQHGTLLGGVPESPEFDRIYNLHWRRLDLDNDFAPGKSGDQTRFYRRPGGTMSLRAVQSAALWEAEMYDGAFIAAGVGEGKSLITLLLPTAMNSERAVLLVGADLRDKLYDQDIPLYGKHFRLPLDRLTVFTYHDLSNARFLDALDRVGPDLIIADEAHRLRHKSAARTRRFMAYMKDHPDTRFVPLTGSPTTRSIMDYAHLINLALGENSPLPRDYPTLTDWSLAIDPPREGQPFNLPGALQKFCINGQSVQEGFQRRFVSAPGVIVTVKSSVASVALNLRQRTPAGGVPRTVRKAIDDLNATWELGGEELMEAMHVASRARELACGFYYRRRWSTGTTPTPHERDWWDAEKAWARAVRHFLTHNARRGLDTPLLLWNACSNDAAPTQDLEEAFATWSAICDSCKPKTEAVWIDDFVIRDALDWADTVKKQQLKGIVWYQHDAVGDALEARGLPRYGAGTDAGASDPVLEPVIVCSVRSQGEGKNLQARSMNYYTSPMANGPAWEQSLGRTHRPGQQEDEVWADLLLHTDENVAALRQAFADARYIQSTQGQPQKLLLATKLFTINGEVL